MKQIKEKKYPESITKYTGEILLVAINYDKKTKEHQCMIEKYEKEQSMIFDEESATKLSKYIILWHFFYAYFLYYFA